MRAQGLAALEWDQLVERVQSFAYSEPARMKLKDLLSPSNWSKDPIQSQIFQNETSEMSLLLDRVSLWSPLKDLEDLTPLLDLLAKSGVLDQKSFILLRSWLYAIDAWFEFPTHEFDLPLFGRSLAQLGDVRKPLMFLDQVFSENGELREDASAELARILRLIRKNKQELDSVSEKILNRLDREGFLQDRFSDMREGRLVFPVKAQYRSQVIGNIYEFSVSRQTVYIEPPEVRVLNQELLNLMNERDTEIFRILSQLSNSMAEYLPDIEVATQVLTYWDGIQAKARLGALYGGKRIQVDGVDHFYFESSAHPLLWFHLKSSEIVRNSVEMNPDCPVLLLSGPNTGGKTVFLKMIGLSAICARTGFLFPGSAESRVPFFDQIFVDLGDPQSMEEHVSSFSGRVLKMKEILEGVSKQSLILIDELNSATDPGEGAALSMAFLECLLEDSDTSPTAVVTTHDPLLKAFSVENSKIETASVQYDSREKRPTYRLDLGIPGRSCAIDTAERLGLPHHLIQKARSYLSEGQEKFENAILNLESDRRELQKIQRSLEFEKAEAEALKERWSNRLSKSVSEEVKNTLEKWDSLYQETEKEVKSTILRLQSESQQSEVSKVRKNMEKIFLQRKEEVKEGVLQAFPELSSESVLKKDQESSFLPREGMRVRVPRWKTVGTIKSIRGDKIQVLLQSNSGDQLLPMTVTLKFHEVEPDENQSTEIKSKKVDLSVEAPGTQSELGAEKDLRGLRFEDAMRELEVYLDHAFRSGWSEVLIIHGLGSGALRKGTRDLIKKIPYISTFEDAGAHRGGPGATVVRFDR